MKMVITYKEQEFRDMVMLSHLNGGFKGDAHRMQIKFKKSARSIDFIAISFVDDEVGTLQGFCGIDIFKVKDKELIGSIHCLGVIQCFRKKGYSIALLNEIEKAAKKTYPELSKILSVCNPISAKSHEKVGYVITNPGRLSANGKLMQIRLCKSL